MGETRPRIYEETRLEQSEKRGIKIDQSSNYPVEANTQKEFKEQENQNKDNDKMEDFFSSTMWKQLRKGAEEP